MPSLITFLRPTWHEAVTAKIFELRDDSPVKTSDYKLGTHFDYHTEEVNSCSDIFTAFRNKRTNFIRIYGTRKKEVPEKNSARGKEFLDDLPSQVLMLDMDKWQTPREFDFTDEFDVEEVIREMLRTEGFPLLSNTSFVRILSSSQWSRTRLSCHLYFWLTEPIERSVIADWCTALQQVRGRAIFDPASARLNQPDYIGARRCEGFNDPMPESCRLALCSSDLLEVDTHQLQEEINKTILQAGWTPGQSKQKTKIGENWMASLKMAGSGAEGINDICHRAAAQLVHERGRNATLANVDNYAREMHGIAWEAIHENDPYSDGSRVLKDDLQTYTIARFTQYLTSACRTDFSGKADAARKTVEDAINVAARGQVAVLYDRPVMAALMLLRSGHPGVYAEVKVMAKRALRGSISWTEYEKQAARSKDNQQDATTGETLFVGDSQGENQYIKRVLSEFDWLIDQNDTQYCGWVNSETKKYTIAQMDNGLTQALYVRGMELSGDTVSPKFGGTCLQYLLGHEEHHKNSPASFFKRAEVGLRVCPVGGAYSSGNDTWINLGEQLDGSHLCVYVSAEEIKVVSEKSCPVKWRKSKSYGGIQLPSEQEVIDRFEDIEGLTRWTLTRLFDFLNVTGDQRPLLIGMIFSMLSGRGTSPVLEFIGPASCGKSTAASLLQDLIDPIKGAVEANSGLIDMGSIPQQHLVETVSNNYFTPFDNVSLMRRVTQDTLCQISTGVSKKHRILYVGTFVEIHAKRPILITALESTITRPDLQSRSETLDFGSCKRFSLSPDRLLTEWKKDKPLLFMGLLHLLQDALRRKEGLKMTSGLDARRSWYTLADPLFYDLKTAMKVKTDRSMKAASESAEHSPFALGVIAWLQNEEKNGAMTKTDRVLHHYEDYCKFINARQGTEVSIGRNGSIINWKVDPYKGAIPDKVVGFGWELMKYAHVIEKMSGWDVYSRKRQDRHGITREFFRIPDEVKTEQHDDELEDL